MYSYLTRQPSRCFGLPAAILRRLAGPAHEELRGGDLSACASSTVVQLAVIERIEPRVCSPPPRRWVPARASSATTTPAKRSRTWPSRGKDATVNFDWSNRPADRCRAGRPFFRELGRQDPATVLRALHLPHDQRRRRAPVGERAGGHRPLGRTTTAGEDVGTVELTAGELYDIKLEYHETTGNAVAKLLWSSPSTRAAVVPSTQLYSVGSGWVSGNWLNQDIGSPNRTGSVRSTGGSYTVQGNGQRGPAAPRTSSSTFTRLSTATARSRCASRRCPAARPPARGADVPRLPRQRRGLRVAFVHPRRGRGGGGRRPDDAPDRHARVAAPASHADLALHRRRRRMGPARARRQRSAPTPPPPATTTPGSPPGWSPSPWGGRFTSGWR